MKTGIEHPQDFGPLLGGDSSEAGREELLGHLASCEDCRAEYESWKACDRVFRDPGFEIELRPALWNSLRSRLAARPAPPSWTERLGAWLVPRRMAWNVAVASLLALTITAAGLQYRRETRLTEIAAYAVQEETELGAAGNPFRAANGQSENPFTAALEADVDNPFSFK